MTKRTERMKVNGGSHTDQEWESLKRWYNNRCAKCGRTGDITKDHVIPVNNGGTDNIWNIQPLCKPCNTSKRDRFATDCRDSFVHKFREEYKRITESRSYFRAQLRSLLFLRGIVPGTRSSKDFDYLVDILWIWGIEGELKELAIKEFVEWLDL